MNSITTRLIVVLTLCSAAVISTGMFLDYRISRDQILEQLRLESQDTVAKVITDMENWLDAVESTTGFFARVLQQRDYSHPELEQMLKDMVENDDDVYGAAIALNSELAGTPEGFAPYYFHRNGILTYANLAGEQSNYQDQAWFKDTVAAGRATWIEPYFDHGGGETLMTTFAVPVYRVNEVGERYLYAVVTADIALLELQSYLQRIKLGDSGQTILLSREGIILSARDPAIIMRHYSEIESGSLDLDTWRNMIEGARTGQTRIQQVQCTDALGRCIFRLAALQSTGWPVGVIYSEHEILAPLRAFQIKTAAISAASLILMALTVFLVTRRLTRPLIGLSKASDDIARGVLDSPLPRAQGNDEIARLIRSFAAMKKDLKTYITDLESVTASRARLQGELAAAREIQMSMLPGGGEANELECDYSLWARVRPAKSVGGDLYTYYRKDRKLFIAVGDVSDKGVPAALFMANAISHIQPMASHFVAPGVAMAQINNALERGNDNCMFVTLFLGVLNLDTLELHFSSAGHTPPSLVRANKVRTITQESGPALGLAADLVYPENWLQLQPSDRLAMFTDGIDEAFNSQAQMFGIARFNHTLKELSELPVSAAGPRLFTTVDDFAGEMPQSDDITLMLVELPSIEEVTAIEDSVSCAFPRGERLVTRVLSWLQGILAQAEIDPACAVELALMAEEMIANVDRHAGLAKDTRVKLTVVLGDDIVALEVRDRGTPFNPLQQGRRPELGADIESAEIGGLGVHLIMQLSHRQHYRREAGYNILRVEKDLPAD